MLLTLAVVISLLSGAISAPSDTTINENFVHLIKTLDDDVLEDLVEDEGGMEAARELYISNVIAGTSYEEEQELLVQDDVMEEEEVEDEDDEAALKVEDKAALPRRFNVGDLGVLHPAIFQGGGCGSCGWVSGTQTLEARIALVSENYRAYSIQNLMNCDGRVCVGTIPYRVNSIVRNKPFIVPEEEMPYVKKGCKTWDPYCFCGQSTYTNYTNVLDEQFVFVGPTVAAHSEDAVIEALQSGPLTTCYAKAKGTGERCKPGCEHANSIIGYTEDSLIIQDSYGKTWGSRNNGTWTTSRNGDCAKALIKKAYYPIVFYDYEKTNAYYTETHVDKAALTLVDKVKYGIGSENTRNIGVAKNKCGFLASACKGVIKMESGEVELVADFGAGSGPDKAFLKTQMVLLLKHSSGKYIGIDEKRKLNLKLVWDKWASPFFISNGRFISYEYPEYFLVGNKLEKIVRGMVHVDLLKAWKLDDVNLRNPDSGKSLDLVDVGGRSRDKTICGRDYDKASASQRFMNVGVSGNWQLKSKALNGTGLRRKNKDGALSFNTITKQKIVYFRWNARQMLTSIGKPFGPDMSLAAGYFKLGDIQNHVQPTDTLIRKFISSGPTAPDKLSVRGKQVVMSTSTTDESRWNFVYKEL